MSGRLADTVTHPGSRTPSLQRLEPFLCRLLSPRRRGAPPRAHLHSRPHAGHSLKQRENTASLPVTAVTKTSFTNEPSRAVPDPGPGDCTGSRE